MKQEHNILKNEAEQLSELTDDIEVVGPGRMLKEARQLKGLSQQQVADKLNFRITLVQEIEAEQFDLAIPVAFNRGYLKNYAKLVNLSQDDVLNSYDQLGVAQRQCAEMQSFSKGTEKQAEHNMVMWITYLILAALVTATVVWWWQTPSEQPEPIVAEAVESVTSDRSEQVSAANSLTLNEQINTEQTAAATNEDNTGSNVLIDTESQRAGNENAAVTQALVAQKDSLALEVGQGAVNPATNKIAAELTSSAAPNNSDITTAIANVVFTFSGDCWVNIYDATGERIAWGVKKSGYVMRISGQAPFSITLGKPELVQIDYNNVSVDMTAFSAGNIAKFSLPLAP